MVLGVLVLALAAEAAPRTIEVTASRFQFDPATIEVQEGEHVALLIHSADGKHGFEIKGYGKKVLVPKGGATVRVELVADKPGSFEFVCSEYCGSGHKKMKGMLTVAPKAAK
jgi:cytochrome c oxidase subunit 2